MRILVTGGAGFIGSHLCERLLEGGDEVICIDNLFTSRRENIAHLLGRRNFEFLRHDVCEPWHVECDRIYHLACPASPVHYQRNPVRTIETAVLGTRNALECARSTGARLLITSTSEVYGDPEEHPQKETYVGHVNTLGPRACYDEGKRVGESLAVSWAAQFGTDVRIARLFNTYGPRMAFKDGRLIPNFVMQAMEGRPLTIYGSGKQTRSFCFVSDTVDGVVRLMEAPRSGAEVPVVNIGNPDERTIESVAQDVLAAFGGGGVEKRPLPADDPKQRCPDIGRARKLLGWEPKVSYAEGIRKTIAWFREQAPIAASGEPRSEKTSPVKSNGKKLAFLLAPWACPRPLRPAGLFTDDRGLTGSEISFIMEATSMAARGYDVTAYTNLSEEDETRGVKFAQWERWTQDADRDWHAAVAFIEPSGLQRIRPGGSLRIFNQQVNDFQYCLGWEAYVDVATSPSAHHQKYLSTLTDFKEWRILPNGCDATLYDAGDKQRTKTIVYASSPDRGLHWVLELFPQLRKRVPGVECHIYYDYRPGLAEIYAQRGEAELSKRFRYIDVVVPKFEGRGVLHHKSVSREAMARILSQSRLLAYPCDPVRYTEGFSCTTLEAAAAGCLPVICGADALGEIYGGFVPMVPAPYASHREEYLDLLTQFLSDDDAYERAQRKARELGPVYDWSGVADRLQSIVEGRKA